MLSELEESLGTLFIKKNLLREAFIHSTYKTEHPALIWESNQVLEFMGDAVLGLIIADYIYDNYYCEIFSDEETLIPTKTEGKYSQFRSKHINGPFLSEIADQLNLDRYLLKGNGEKKNPAGKAKRLEDLMEAIIGAVYRDQGYAAAQKFVLKHFIPRMEESFMELHEKGLLAVEEKLRDRPNDHNFLTQKGNILCGLKRYKEALEVLEKALSIKPNNEKTLFGKFDCLAEIGNYEVGLITVDKIISINPEYSLIWVHRGDMLRSLGRTEEALEAYLTAIEYQSYDPDALFEIAKIYSSKKDKEESLLYLEKALEYEIRMDESIHCGTHIKMDSVTAEEFRWLQNDTDFLKLVKE
jgi:ribonuclease-3